MQKISGCLSKCKVQNPITLTSAN